MSVEGRRPRHKPDGDSHNGSAADFDSVYIGSIPVTPAKPKKRLFIVKHEGEKKT